MSHRPAWVTKAIQPGLSSQLDAEKSGEFAGGSCRWMDTSNSLFTSGVRVMSGKSGNFGKRFFVAMLLGLSFLFLSATPTPAETSAKRLERKLKKLERKTGQALKITAEVAGDVLIEVLSHIELGDDDSELITSCALAKKCTSRDELRGGATSPHKAASGHPAGKRGP